MARLFSKDFHLRSDTWFFNQVIIPLEKEDLLFWKSIDEEDHIHLRFFPTPEKRDLFCNSLDLEYDPQTERIISHKCSECDTDENCRHYLSLLRFAYHHLTTEIFAEEVVETCFGKLLVSTPEWLDRLSGPKIWLEGIYTPETDKVRFYFSEYQFLELRLFISAALGKDEPWNDPKQKAQYRQAVATLSDHEIRLLEYLDTQRVALSTKAKFISIYKKSFATALGIMKNIPGKFMIKETGETLVFNEHPLALSLRVQQYGADIFRLAPVIIDDLSVWYAGHPTWLFFGNIIREVDLPFELAVIDRLFERDLLLRKKDLVYLRTLVIKELQGKDIYLDFDERIELPLIYDNPPTIKLEIFRQEDSILLRGSLIYEPEVVIPLSVVRFNSPLIKTSFENPEGHKENAWFQIPVTVFRTVKQLTKILPNADLRRLESSSELIFRTDPQSFERLKQAIFELSDSDLAIEISEELQREFIYKVPLQADISFRKNLDTDWFDYEVQYSYKDFRFTHEELKAFFLSQEKFLTTADGRTVFITKRSVFDETEKLIATSHKTIESVYRSRIMNLPYYLKLQDENPAFRIRADEFILKLCKDLVSRKSDLAESLPSYLQTVLRGYQKAGHNWIKMLAHYRLGGILADEMGLGKTIQALSIISETPDQSISLVVCPKTLTYNWAAEIDKFHTNIPFLIVEGSKEERKLLLSTPNVKLFIISYSLVLNELEVLKNMKFEWLILDEAQNIKNAGTQRSTAIKKLQSTHRLALSGTPIENSMQELWSVFDFILPGYLGTLGRFKREYLVDPDPQESIQKLQRAVAPFILRREKKEVLLELPDKQEQIAWCKLNSIQEKSYLQILDLVQKSLQNKQDLSYIHILAALTKLRQVCNHPHLINPDILPETAASAKLELLMELVKESLLSGHKILIFSQFVQMLKIIRKAFEEHKIAYAYLDGQTKDRITPIRSFEEDSHLKTFLISLKTGGTGLNLTAADTVILFDPWWNPMIENQAIDRSHRIGQQKKVQVFRLISKGTVEEKINLLQQSKLDLFQSLIGEGHKSLQTLDPELLKDLFRYDRE
ncbi:MAG: DEAD/DEAH box helicase [Candidatus Cloacimonetes bacterium]|nr:DEAD/DEAH box helicase [Candidatus Cloacimonadota bacterium]